MSSGQPKHAFHTRTELIEKLRDFRDSRLTKVITKYKDKPEWKGKNPTGILHRFPSYRSFPNESPGQRFQRWRWYDKADAICQRLKKMSKQSDFDQFAFELGLSLVEDWGPKGDMGQDSRMNLGVAMKIVNLLFKHLTYIWGIQNHQLVNFLHVPWDKYTLQPLRFIFNESVREYRMPATASMGFVKTRDMYVALHAFISTICGEAGVPRIYYEFYAWDDSHD